MTIRYEAFKDGWMASAISRHGQELFQFAARREAAEAQILEVLAAENAKAQRDPPVDLKDILAAYKGQQRSFAPMRMDGSDADMVPEPLITWK